MPVSFKGAHFPQEIILTGVRWYLVQLVTIKYPIIMLPWQAPRP
jgi:transposase-like protein